MRLLPSAFDPMAKLLKGCRTTALEKRRGRSKRLVWVLRICPLSGNRPPKQTGGFRPVLAGRLGILLAWSRAFHEPALVRTVPFAMHGRGSNSSHPLPAVYGAEAAVAEQIGLRWVARMSARATRTKWRTGAMQPT